MANDAPKLDISIRSMLRPHLEAEGFKGSGKNFQRVKDGWIHAVGLAASRHGGSFAIDLAVHPEGVPTEFQSDPKKFRTNDCEFRCRLSETGADQWWAYENTQSSMDATVALATDVYLRIGRPFLTQFSEPHCPLTALTASDLLSGRLAQLGFFLPTAIRAALTLARMHKSRGNPELARQFAEWGLANLGQAISLKRPFEQLLI
jgi:hypothetical protein